MELQIEKYIVTKNEDSKDYFWDWISDEWKESLFPEGTHLTIFSSEDEAEHCRQHATYIVPKDKDNMKVQKIQITAKELES